MLPFKNFCAYRLTAACCLCAAGVSGQGLAPRKTPAEYAAATQNAQCSYAASLLSPEQVKHLFAVDVSKTYLVFEVAVYPVAGSKVTIDSDDFLLKAGKNSEMVHTADAMTVASVMEQKNKPAQDRVGRDVSLYPSASVGYESGTDPYTGRRVHGTYTEVGVTATTDPRNDPNYDPGYPPASRIDPRQLQALEDQLSRRALTGGEIAQPAAGYLYFPVTKGTKDSAGVYALDYLGDRAAKVELIVPRKSR